MLDSYIRHSTLTIEEGLSLLSKWYKEYNPTGLAHDPVLIKKARTEKETIGDIRVKKYSQRYRLFLDGITCVGCGLVASYFAVEKNKCTKGNNYHLNLYGIDKFNQHVLFTKDHIQPKSKGGRNHHDNYQLMCCHCNWDKADTIEGEEQKPCSRSPKSKFKALCNSSSEKVTGLHKKLKDRDFTVIERISSKTKVVALDIGDTFITCCYHKTRHGNISVKNVIEITKETHADYCTKFKSEMEKKAEFMSTKTLDKIK